MYKDVPNKYTYYFNPCSPWSCQSGSPAVAAVKKFMIIKYIVLLLLYYV